MFVFSSIDAKGICHLNNKSHAAFEGGKKTKWGGRKTKRKNDLVSREGEEENFSDGESSKIKECKS
jgi:hypothetical protein